jgi:hypothetical protein
VVVIVQRPSTGNEMLNIPLFIEISEIFSKYVESVSSLYYDIIIIIKLTNNFLTVSKKSSPYSQFSALRKFSFKNESSLLRFHLIGG